MPMIKTTLSTPLYKVAIVEDEVDLNELYQNLFQDAFDLRIFDSASSAIEALRSGYRPDALVTDIIMAGTDGYELIDFCQNQGYCFPILISTGEDQVWKNLFDRNLFVSFVLEKPFSSEIMSAQIINAILSFKVSDTLRMAHFYLLQLKFLELELKVLVEKQEKFLPFNSVTLVQLQNHLQYSEKSYKLARALHRSALDVAERFNPALASVLEIHSEKSFSLDP